MAELAVVIPTRDRPAQLADCLATLRAQEPELDVLVVDDSDAGTARPAGARTIRTGGVGLNLARNAGVAATSAPVVAFLDDDVLVAPGWAAALLDAFRSGTWAAAGGRVTLRLEAPAPRWLTPGRRSYLAELDLGDAPAELTAGRTPVGANCAVRRAALGAHGTFRPGLDRTAGSLVSNGEVELFRRLLAAGERLAYVPGAAVEHRVPAERLTVAWFRRRARAQGLSDALLDPGPAAREVVRAGRAAPILVRGLVERRDAVNALLWLEYCAGRLAGARQDARR